MLGRLSLSAKDEGHFKRRGKMCKLKKKKKKIDTELCLQVPGRESIIKLISPRSLLYSNIFILPLGSVQNKKKRFISGINLSSYTYVHIEVQTTFMKSILAYFFIPFLISLTRLPPLNFSQNLI